MHRYSQFEGATFCTLSEILYQKLGIVLFALEVEDLKRDKASTRLLLNPAEFVIPPKSEYRIDAFVMAKNKAQSDLTFSRSSNDSIIGECLRSHLFRYPITFVPLFVQYTFGQYLSLNWRRGSYL